MFCAYVYDFIVIFILTKTHYSHLCAKKWHTNVTMYAFIYSFIHSLNHLYFIMIVDFKT